MILQSLGAFLFFHHRGFAGVTKASQLKEASRDAQAWVLTPQKPLEHLALAPISVLSDLGKLGVAQQGGTERRKGRMLSSGQGTVSLSPISMHPHTWTT